MSVDIRANTDHPRRTVLNVANGNFAHLMRALDFDVDVVYDNGFLTAGTLAAAVARLRRGMVADPAEFERSENSYRGNGGCNVIECGCSSEQMARYLDRLSAIIVEAVADDVDICIS